VCARRIAIVRTLALNAREDDGFERQRREPTRWRAVELDESSQQAKQSTASEARDTRSWIATHARAYSDDVSNDSFVVTRDRCRRYARARRLESRGQRREANSDGSVKVARRTLHALRQRRIAFFNSCNR
jgi:hypothetical protein